MLMYMRKLAVSVRFVWVAAVVVSLLFAWPLARAHADKNFPNQTSSGSVGMQGTISSPPPARGATITTPGNGAVVTVIPITVSGLCPSNVLVKVFSNNVFVGSAPCNNGSYTMQISLFSGQNDLVARVYDALDQSGPDSNVVTVTFNDAQFAQFGTHVTLESPYAERGAPPGQEITWPVLLTGGTGPYAISVDWGDGSPTDLISQGTTGTIILKHTYKSAGVYKVIVKATDKNGGTAFLQLTGQATGATQSNTKKDGGNSVVRVEVLWWPALAMLPLIFAAFWVGQRHELFSLRKQLERSRDREIA
jgi:hypothetical protein